MLTCSLELGREPYSKMLQFNVIRRKSLSTPVFTIKYHYTRYTGSQSTPMLYSREIEIMYAYAIYFKMGKSVIYHLYSLQMTLTYITNV